jgi:hypothetical protein
MAAQLCDSLYIQNSSSERLIFDTLDGGFVSARGGSLRSPMYNLQGDHLWRLEPGERTEFSYDTNGYTDRLIAGADERGVRFVVTLYYEKRVIAGPFLATLPPLAQASVAGTSLSFTEVKITGWEAPESPPPPPQVTAQVAQSTPYKLIAAIQAGNFEEARRLVSSGANVNQKSPPPLDEPHEMEEAAALQWAVYREASPEFIKFLLKNGAEVDSVDKYGSSALHHAAVRGNIEIVKILIDHGANVNLRNKRDRTPLMFAESMGHQEVIALLKAHGANR